MKNTSECKLPRCNDYHHQNAALLATVVRNENKEAFVLKMQHHVLKHEEVGMKFSFLACISYMVLGIQMAF